MNYKTNMNIFDYLSGYEPGNLRKISDNTYGIQPYAYGNTSDCSSIVINRKNGEWLWHRFSNNTGGPDAVSFLTKVEGMTEEKAREYISGINGSAPRTFAPREPPEKKDREFAPPEICGDCSHIKQYLRGRGIRPDIINWCVGRGILAETKRGYSYYNVLFIGRDGDGKMRYGNLRGTEGDFKGEVAGSDKQYGFRIQGTERPESVHVFEAAIDALSYATLLSEKGKDWKQTALLSLGGVSPQALNRFLKENDSVKTVYLSLDNDATGSEATEKFLNAFKGTKYRVKDFRVGLQYGRTVFGNDGAVKDWNDALKAIKKNPGLQKYFFQDKPRAKAEREER